MRLLALLACLAIVLPLHDGEHTGTPDVRPRKDVLKHALAFAL